MGWKRKMTIQNFKQFLISFEFQFATRVLGALLFIYIALITSWISDDAQITFRTILNFTSGLGISFNYGERVQAFTHPLWFFVLSSIIVFTKELFLTTQIMSILISVLAILILTKIEFKLQIGKFVAVSPIFFLLFSSAFCDYMTSGLESSLTYLLVSLLFYLLFCTGKLRNLRYIFLILSLIVLNRLDHGLIFLPLALVLMYTFLNRKNFFSVLWMGVFLFIIWISFSTVYFGSPFPNTFYAKLHADYPINEVLSRGIDYYKALILDFNSVIILLLGFLSLIFFRDKFTIALMIGKILYFFYILFAGGDFMQGRFFAVLIFVSTGEFLFAINKSQASKEIKDKFMLSLFVLIFSFSIPLDAPIYAKTKYLPRHDFNGIVDERGYYHRFNGLFSSSRVSWPEFVYHEKRVPENYRVACGRLGKNSLTSSSRVIIDSCGLTDPYLSHLPAIRTPDWRIGHHYRKIPTEYGLLKTGKLGKIPDQNLQSLFNDISIVVSGDLFTIQRFKAIWRLLMDSYSEVDFSRYSDPYIWVPLTNLVEQKEIVNWNADLHYTDFNGNLKYEAVTPKRTSVMWLKIDWAHSYDLFINGTKIYTLKKDGQDCEFGVKILFQDEQNIKSIAFYETDVTHFNHHGYNYMEFLRLRGEGGEVFIEPHCIIKI